MSKEEQMDLEVRILYLEDALESINKVMMEQQNILDKLESRNTFLLEKMQELSDQMEEAPASERPPHY